MSDLPIFENLHAAAFAYLADVGQRDEPSNRRARSYQPYAFQSIFPPPDKADGLDSVSFVQIPGNCSVYLP